MSLSAALHAVVSTLRRRPSDLLPFYVLGAAAPAIARLFTFLGLGAALLSLRATGRLGPAVAELTSRDLNAPDPNAEPEAFAAWVEGLAPVLEPLFTPAAVGAVAAGVLLTLLTMVVLWAAAAAGQLAACHARLRSERGLTAGIGGLRRRWSTFLGLYLLEGAIWVVVVGVAALAAAIGFAVAPVLGALVGALAFLVSFAVVAAARAVFAIAPVAAVVDGAGVLGSLRGSGGFLRRNPIEAAGYYLIAVGALVGFWTGVAALSVVEAGSLAAPLAFLVLSPALDLFKTGLYAEHRGSFDPPTSPSGTVRGQLASGVRRGLGALVGFARGAPGVHVLAIALALAGVAAGWVAAEPFVGALDASIASRLEDHVPPVAALAYFGNNLTVSLATAYSGLALAVPAAVSLWFNGVVVGALSRLEVDPAALAAFVAPHGLFEFPAILVSGALGLHLGRAWWRTWRGRASRPELADALERAFWVLVGVGVLLAVAALLEGFFSPYYWRLFL